ncbi:MAG: DNA topoisomerase IB [Gemmatimonadota bacterium]
MATKRRSSRKPKPVGPFTDPVDAARAAALRYESDSSPGIRRSRSGRGFSYVDLSGKVVRDKATLSRIRALVIPPAWTDVWISTRENGHLQATGRDAKRRKQYKYHRRWHEVRDETKYGRMEYFGRALPKIRERVNADLARSGLPRNKLLAVVVRLLETTFIRVGNEEYAKTNGSFGLTTMLNRHLKVEGSKTHFRFQGKSGKAHAIPVTDRRLARLVKQCRDLPGQDLFQYIDEDGQAQPISSSDVNEYLQAVSGQDFTAKDFRTWAGSLLATQSLTDSGCFDSGEVAVKSAAVSAVAEVAHKLGNTPSVCRKCYIHPSVLEAYQDRPLFDLWLKASAEEDSKPGLTPEESALLRFLAAASPGSG